MTVSEIKALLTGVDPNISRYFSASPDGNYTVWTEVERKDMKADNENTERAVVFEVLRYTKDEDDTIAAALDTALKAAKICYKWQTTPIPGTDYIRHLFSCECAEGEENGADES